MRKQEYKEQKQPRRYYFFDYLFWLGEITWLNYHTYDIKQPNGNEMLVVCSMSFIFIPILTVVGHFLYDYDRSIFEIFSLVLLIVWIVAVIMKDRLLGKIYHPPVGKRSCSIMKDASSAKPGVTFSFLPSFFYSYRNWFCYQPH